MTLLPILILALVQGLTEFLPISSSGHLVLVHHLMGDSGKMWQDNLMLDVAVHVGTLLAVLIYFRNDVAHMLKALPCLIDCQTQNVDAQLNIKVILASVPVIIAGFILYLTQPAFLRNLEIMAWSTIIFGLLLGWIDYKKPQILKTENLSIRHVLFIGSTQILALIPGTSRSGITMTAGRYLGMTRTEAARFSLLLSIVAIAGAGVIGFREWLHNGTSLLGMEAIIAIILSFITAYLSIAVMMRWLEKAGFMPFVIYRVLLGCLLLGLIYSGAL